MTSLRIQKHRQGRYNSYKASLYACLASLLTCYSAMVASEPTSRSLNTWQVPFDYTSALIHVPYRELTSSEKPWHLCALYPHLKDPYWLSVNYGMVSESERLDVNLTVFEAGGYPQVGNQLKQIQQCVDNNADAIVLGAVSFASLESSLVKIAQHTPIIAAVNDISDPGISAKVGVSWYSMGKKVGDYLASRHPKGSPKVDIAWFPGPHGAGWVHFLEAGFRAALANSSVNILSVRWGDTGKEIQRNLLQEVLSEHQDFDYIVGTALTADAAVSELLNKGLRGKIQILSTYMTQNVLRGIKRGHILAAPNDAPVLQGRLAIEQAVRVLENKVRYQHLGPNIELVNAKNIALFDPTSVLPPTTFWPTFKVTSKASMGDE